MTTTITVHQVEPRPGKKQGIVKDTEGRSWYVWNDKLHYYQVGASYDVLETKSAELNGTTYVTIAKSVPVGGGVAAPAPRAAAPALIPHPILTQQAKLPMAAPPKPDHSADDARRMDIFVCGFMNNLASNAGHPISLEKGYLISLIEDLKEVWAKTLGPQARMQSKPTPPKSSASQGDMDDDIPF